MWVIVLLDGYNNFTLCGPYESMPDAVQAMNMRSLGTNHGGMYYYRLKDINDETVEASA
jgi:hypothetical protein